MNECVLSKRVSASKLPSSKVPRNCSLRAATRDERCGSISRFHPRNRLREFLSNLLVCVLERKRRQDFWRMIGAAIDVTDRNPRGRSEMLNIDVLLDGLMSFSDQIVQLQYQVSTEDNVTSRLYLVWRSNTNISTELKMTQMWLEKCLHLDGFVVIKSTEIDVR